MVFVNDTAQQLVNKLKVVLDILFELQRTGPSRSWWLGREVTHALTPQITKIQDQIEHVD
jgi:hypothetical protein